MTRFLAISTQYEEQLRSLLLIVNESEQRIISDAPDMFFVTHSNFLTKSYLITLCSYLEAFLKDVATEHITHIKNRIVLAKIPHNIILWSMANKTKQTDFEYKDFTLSITNKEIDDELSGNPFRTSNFFKLIGIDIDSAESFQELRDIINTVVAKRNKIIHYNDNANDITLGDIKNYISTFLSYGSSIITSTNQSTPA